MPQTSTGAHVAVLAFPFGSHAAPLLSVINCLAISAPNTHFSFINTEESNKTIFSTCKQPNIKAYNVSDGVPESYVFVGKHQERIELFLNAAPGNFKKEIEAAEADTGKRVSCLVTDAFFWFAAEMAEELRVPWVACWTSGPSSLSAHVYTELIRETFGVRDIEGREDEQLEIIPGMSKIRIRDLPEGVLFGNLQSVFSHMLHQMGLMLPKAAAVYINSFEELDPTITNDLKSKFKNFLNIGPFNLISQPSPVPGTNGCLSWLHKQKDASVVYVSFGTVTKPSPKELVALAEALEASKVPFIWSLKDDLKVHLPNEFLEKTKSHGIMLEWAPQLDVLAHDAVGAFITHCGWNSILESIVGGVPMICRPFFGDQRLNARMIQDAWEIGVTVDGGIFTKNGLMSSLDQILRQEKGKKTRDKIKTLKELAQKATTTKGSSIKNFKALVDLTSG